METIYIPSEYSHSLNFRYNDAARLAIDNISNSLDILYETVNRLSKSLAESLPQLIDNFADSFTEISRIINETLKRLLSNLVTVSSDQGSNINWSARYPSFNSESYDVTTPANGPPSIEENYQTEKEKYLKIGLVIFAALIILGLLLEPSFHQFVEKKISGFEAKYPLFLRLFPLLEKVVGLYGLNTLIKKINDFFK